MLKFLFLCASRLPLPLLHALGATFGALAYRLSPSLRTQIAANMTQAGYADPAMHRAAARETGKGVAELAAVWLRPLDEVAKMVREVQGWEHVEAAHAAGRAVVVMTPHLGCFEIIAQTYAWRTTPDKPMTVLFRPPRKAQLAPLFQAGRGRDNLRQAPAELSGVRALLRALKNGEAIGMLPDQAPRFGEGIWSPFFGRMAFTMTLAHRLVRDGSALLLLTRAERLPRGRGFRVVFQPCPETIAQDQAAGVAQINRLVEGMIRLAPTQYLWAYNRYKIPQGVPRPPEAPSGAPTTASLSTGSPLTDAPSPAAPE